jgi:hypothetical protein
MMALSTLVVLQYWFDWFDCLTKKGNQWCCGSLLFLGAFHFPFSSMEVNRCIPSLAVALDTGFFDH